MLVPISQLQQAQSLNDTVTNLLSAQAATQATSLLGRTVDLNSGHETWGGDKNGKIDYPITAVIFTVGQPTDQGKSRAAEGDLHFGFAVRAVR